MACFLNTLETVLCGSVRFDEAGGMNSEGNISIYLIFIFKKIKRSELRKGMFLISEKSNPVASWEFEAEILVLHHPTTISINYQAMGKNKFKFKIFTVVLT